MGKAVKDPPKKRLRKYRVSWTRDGGMSLMSATEVITATNDKEALKVASVLVGNEHFKLEHFRQIKN